MPWSVIKQYLSPAGRLSRAAFNLSLILSLPLLLGLLGLLSLRAAPLPVWPQITWLLLLGLLAVRRLHDTGLRGWWLLGLALPLLGPALLLWQLCCKAGMPMENRFGADPCAPSTDYLTVS